MFDIKQDKTNIAETDTLAMHFLCKSILATVGLGKYSRVGGFLGFFLTFKYTLFF
jgi:hypothetical protein